ncbi:TPA: restriction endonuclease subunit S [Vibrio cholerae]
MSFKMTTLGEYAKVQGGFAYKSKDFIGASEYRVLKIKNVRFGTIDYSEPAFVPKNIAESTINWKLKEGDILISMTGSGPNAPQSLVGRVARVWKNEPDAWFNQRVGRINLVDNKKIHPDFLFYWLSLPQNQDFLVSNSSGSANQANISGKTIESLPTPIVDYEISSAIAKIARELDEKIILNTQTNQTLEQIAQAIFKSWFVDFDPVKAKINTLAAGGSADDAELAAMRVISAKTVDELNSLKASNPEAFNKLAQTAALFPAAMQDSELGEIPEGWEVKSLGEFTSTFDYVANGSFAALKANVKLFDEPNDVLYVRTTDFNKGFKSELKYTDNSSYQFLAKSKLFGHETIISNVGDVGTVFRAPSWYGMPMTLGSNAMGIVAEGANSYIYYLFKSPLGQHLLDGITSGSAQMKFNKTSFRKLRVVLPNSVLLIKFEEFEASLWTKHTSNQKESLHLENLRDSLLPKLLSGEIDLTSEVVE